MNATTLLNKGRQATAKQGLVIQLASSLTVVGSVMIAPMLPKIGAEFGATDPSIVEMVPLIATGPALAIALFAPVAGWLAGLVVRGFGFGLVGNIIIGIIVICPRTIGRRDC